MNLFKRKRKFTEEDMIGFGVFISNEYKKIVSQLPSILDNPTSDKELLKEYMDKHCPKTRKIKSLQ